ncbi:response regulator transcription factor [Aquipuribacter sp. SD81]|uniref:response regulator transcription factor n=1 Tax=Aquipuribacter sp. SD81 TaxID=3127703 RepID=UPI0030195F1E
MPRVLVVDDDPTVREVVRAYLTRDGHDVDEAADAAAALDSARVHVPDLVVLDVMLPGGSGLEVCRALRRDRADVPVILLTALGEEGDRVAGLVAGADDYVAKPFSPRELVLRVRSVLRRTTAAEARSGPAEVLRDGDLEVDVAARRAALAGRELALTGRELALLEHLLRHPGQAFSREDLLRQVWGWDFGDLSTVTVHVRRLRHKVEPDPGRPHRLVTVWGVGYRWDAGGGHDAGDEGP